MAKQESTDPQEALHGLCREYHGFRGTRAGRSDLAKLMLLGTATDEYAALPRDAREQMAVTAHETIEFLTDIDLTLSQQ